MRSIKRTRIIKALKILKVVIGFILITTLVVVFLRWPIKSVACENQYGPCSEEIANSLSLNQTKLYKIKLGKFVNDRLTGLNKVAEYSYAFEFPFGARVYVIEKKPQIALSFEGDSKFYLYTAQGIKIEETDKTELPIVEIWGDSTEVERIFGSEISFILFTEYNINKIRLGNKRIEFKYKEYDIIFPTSGDIDIILGSFELVLSWLNSQAQELKISLVDFRYKNPVIK